MKVPVGFNWLIAGISFIEARIEKSLTFLAEKKELVLIPFICNFWPCWLTPNRITAFRLLISLAIIFWLILKGAPLYQNNYWLAIVVIIACLTDLFDGPVARAMKKESKIGSLFDKIVDKFLILPLGIVQFWTLDSLLVVLSIAGTIVVVITAIYKYFQAEAEVPENIFGKFAMICYSLAIIIAIWPIWQNFALKIAWLGFGLAFSSVILNFRRHFGINISI